MPERQGSPSTLSVSIQTGVSSISTKRLLLLCFVSFIHNLPVNWRQAMVLQIGIRLRKMLASKKALQVKAIVSDEVSVAGLKQLDKHSGLPGNSMLALHIPCLLTAQKDELQSEHGGVLCQHLLPSVQRTCPTGETPRSASYGSRHLLQHL